MTVHAVYTLLIRTGFAVSSEDEYLVSRIAPPEGAELRHPHLCNHNTLRPHPSSAQPSFFSVLGQLCVT